MHVGDSGDLDDGAEPGIAVWGIDLAQAAVGVGDFEGARMCVSEGGDGIGELICEGTLFRKHRLRWHLASGLDHGISHS